MESLGKYGHVLHFTFLTIFLCFVLLDCILFYCLVLYCTVLYYTVLTILYTTQEKAIQFYWHNFSQKYLGFYSIYSFIFLLLCYSHLTVFIFYPHLHFFLFMILFLFFSRICIDVFSERLTTLARIKGSEISIII